MRRCEGRLCSLFQHSWSEVAATASVSEIQRCDYVLAGRLCSPEEADHQQRTSSVRRVKNQKTMTVCFDRAKALEQGMPRRHPVEDLTRQNLIPQGDGMVLIRHTSASRSSMCYPSRPKAPWEHVTMRRTALLTSTTTKQFARVNNTALPAPLAYQPYLPTNPTDGRENPINSIQYETSKTPIC